MRKIFIALILLGTLSLSAQVVARVGKYYVTESSLEEEIDYLFDMQRTPSTYYALRRQAMDNLIEEKLMASFADEYGIIVDSSEVEAYFINEYGDHPQFQENGAFSYLKFKRLLQKPRMQKIWQDLYNDLLFSKTRKIIEESFDLTDEMIRDQFVTSSFQFDIGYITIDGELLDVPQGCTLEGAMKFYQKNYQRYKSPKQVRLELYVMQDDALPLPPEVSEADLMEIYLPLASVKPLDEVRDSLVALLTVRNRHQAVLDSLEIIRQLVENNRPSPISPVLTDYLEYSGTIGDFEQSRQILERAFELDERSVSEIFDIGFGSMFFRVLDIIEPRSELTPEVGMKAWKDYIEDAATMQNAGDFREYYYQNIDRFIVPAAYVTRIVVNPEKYRSQIDIPEAALQQYYRSNRQEFNRRGRTMSYDDARELILEKMQNQAIQERLEEIRGSVLPVLRDDSTLKALQAEMGFNMDRAIVFMERLENVEPIDDYIAYAIKRNPDASSGVLNYRDNLVIYRLDSVFPEYIPSYEQIQSQLPGIKQEITPADTSAYRLFYDRNLSYFTTPDSLSIGGALFPLETDSVYVSDIEVKNYFQKHKKEFYMSPRVDYEAFFLRDPNGTRQEYLQYLYSYASREKSLKLLQKLVGSEYKAPMSGSAYLDELPVEMRNALEDIYSNEVSEPIFVDDGWLMVMKTGSKAAGAAQFYEVRESIRHKLELREADSLAYKKARYIFDNANYFSDVLTLTDSTYIYDTEKKAIDEDFEPFGSVWEFRQRFMQLYRNEKYTSVVKTRNGYAVLFMRKKKYGQQIPYLDALPQIRNMYEDETRKKQRKEFLIQLLQQLRSGENDESQLVFLGEWKHAYDLTIDGEIPGVEYSEYILADAAKKAKGEYSYPIRLQDDSYLLYRVENAHKTDRASIEKDLKSFKKALLQKKFEDWMHEYRATVGVEIY